MSTKVERIDKVDNVLTREELLRRLPEVDLILDEDVREGTIDAFLKGCPRYFWTIPSSGTGKYHLPDERGEFGNVLHTKRVFVTYCSISRSFLELGLITEFERECGKAAALLHDMLKFGWPSSKKDYAVNDHDLIAADVARVLGELPDEVVLAIDAHNGPWSEGKLPEDSFELIFHLADYVAAKRVLGAPHIIRPSTELQEAFPDAPVLTDEEVEGIL